MLKMAIAQAMLHWGFWIRYPLASARQDTYVVPQPSTLVGALGAGLARAISGLCGVAIPEIIHNPRARDMQSRYSVPIITFILPAIKDVYFRVLSGWGIRSMDITRHFQGTYIRVEDLKDPSQWFAVRVTGKVYAPKMEIEIAYLVDTEKLREALGEFECNVDPEKALLYGLASMTRLGPVEGLLTIEGISILNVEEARGKLMNEPCPYFRISHVPSGLGSDVTIAEFWDWGRAEFWSGLRVPNPDYTLKYVVPLNKSSLDSGLLMPFKPCKLLRDIINEVYLVKVNGNEYTYPKPQ
ncbi:MAG: type I-A CRISPR-associated protein Cas5 [Caldivirga sp.]|nr:type I-A CRISPR-associated protein Cas5 [Caldivirga sp.]